MNAMRTIFMVLAIPNDSPTAMTYNMPANQKLEEVLKLMLALPGAFAADGMWGSVDIYQMCDLYAQPIDPNILVRQVPFPGCVIAVPKNIEVEYDGEKVRGEEATELMTRSISMKLLAQRRDEDDPLCRRYGRYIEGGAWRVDPTPITSHDVALTYHESNAAAGERLRELLTERKLRCRVRCVKAESSAAAEDEAPTDDVRALVVLVSPETQHNPWIAYDVGAAWALGIPVVPILVGQWKDEPPNILAPYQRLDWGTQQQRIVDQLVELLDLTPWKIPVAEETETVAQGKTKPRKAPSRPGNGAHGRRKKKR